MTHTHTHTHTHTYTYTHTHTHTHTHTRTHTHTHTRRGTQIDRQIDSVSLSPPLSLSERKRGKCKGKVKGKQRLAVRPAHKCGDFYSRSKYTFIIPGETVTVLFSKLAYAC